MSDHPKRLNDTQRTEVSKRVAAENALGEANEMFHLLVNAVKDYAIFALDPEGYILTWNEGARRLKGYEAHEIIGSHFSRFYTKEDIDRKHPQHELELAKQNGSYEEEGWRIAKDGTRFWANVLITALWDKNGELKGFAKVTRDLTARKRAEDAIRKANENLEERVRLRTQELATARDEAEKAVRARDEFLSIASHELKTPLTTLKLQLQLRERQLQNGKLEMFSPEKLKKMVSDDTKQVNRITRLVEDMLDITRLNSGKLVLKKENVDLGSLVHDVLNRFSVELQELGISVDRDISTGIQGDWDRYRIEQVFSNLLTNAMKYGAGKPIHVSVSKEGPTGVLWVKDSGVGIEPQDQARVFEKFERTPNATSASGLGLGLFIVKQIVEAHHGVISLESQVGKGSTFTVKLPCL